MSEAAVRAWAPPAIGGGTIVRSREPIIAENLDAVQRAAWDVAHARGLEQGLRAAEAQAQERLQRLDAEVARVQAIAAALARPLEALDAEVERELAQLACVVAKQVIRREMKQDPAQVIAVVREAIRLLPSSARDVRVQLHPEDAALIRERLADTSGERAWTLVEDPTLLRGGCLVRSGPSEIDARLESRVAAAVAAALGDDRALRETPDAAAVATDP